MNKTSPLTWLLAFWLALTLAPGAARAAETGSTGISVLAQDFNHPPASARPWVYWFWLNGNVTTNGITADLEAMQRVGIGGVLIMCVDQGAPAGPASFGGPLWRRLFHYACVEAHRLGLKINMNNDAGWCGSGGPWITPALSMQKVVWAQTNLVGPLHFTGQLPQPKAVRHYYRDIAVLAFPTPAGHYRIPDIQAKAAFTRQEFFPPASFATLPHHDIIPQEDIRNLTDQMDAAGHLTWEVPPGKWTILRFGHTSTGVENHPAPAGGLGLECDKLSTTAVDAQFAGLMGKLIADSRPLVPGTLVSTHIDSWEVGSQNWTPNFRTDFRRDRGYDLLPFLPVLTGRVVDSEEVSERFLWDVRQTVSDLLVTNYAGHLRDLAHRYGMRLSIEAYDGTPCDDMTYAGQADEPMAEFWSYGYNSAYSVLEMASAAHTYGKRILGAESFTASDAEKWLAYPASIKALGDWAFCQGINRFVFHRYAMQPWRDRRPGMSMGPWGLHYERTETWWNETPGWHRYLARCQYLLRQGHFVADICYLEPQGSPRRFHPPAAYAHGRTPERPDYNYDGCTAQVILTRMQVRNGRLVLPDGMSYRVLVLPNVPSMTPSLLRKIRDLVKAGATVIGPPPHRSPSLSHYPSCDTRIQRLADELWGPGAMAQSNPGTQPAGSAAGLHQHRLGKGRVIWGGVLAQRPSAIPSLKTLFAHARWIWYPEGNPVVAAPVATRYFRRTFQLEPGRSLTSARIALTADNEFLLWVNGHKVGTGDIYTQPKSYDVTSLLHGGTNLLAVAATNGGADPNPAGLLVGLTLKFRSGPTVRVLSDSQWRAATSAPADWTHATATTGDWRAARDLGPLGISPWNDVAKPTTPPNLYPDAAALAAAVFRPMGLPPDFQADAQLRYIHRRDGDLDLYFVANPANTWVGADCRFRVTGKIPELWNPITGAIRQQRIFTVEQGRTTLPLWLKPSGSVFVVFRPATSVADVSRLKAAIAGVSRNGESLLPTAGQPHTAHPPLQVLNSSRDTLRLRVWREGHYELNTATDQASTLAVESIPAPVTLTGPWKLSFPPHWGAPAQVTLDRLISWSHDSRPGVKYFSGTATYHTTFNWTPETSSDADQAPVVFLDLGTVRIIAQVTLNGTKLGTLWKPPFRVNVTKALKSGPNTLEIKVTNLWPNRMIGDAHLPEDSARNPNGTLKAWPAWLEAGQPSPTGRYTFTSWRLWKKNDPLQPSGLLGPVTLESAVDVSLKTP